MSVMTVRYREPLHWTLLFLRRTFSEVRRLFEALKDQENCEYGHFSQSVILNAKV